MSSDFASLDVKRSHIHSTWAGTFKCRPSLYFQPATVDQIRTIVKEAGDAGKTVMLTGSGHSPSVLTMTRDWLVNLDRFNKVITMEEHPQGKWTDVTVEAGMRLYELNEHLAEHDLAIQNLGSISDQSVAGVISTGSHGSSAYHGLISQQVVDFTILVASGDLITCSELENVDLFRAGLISLGKLGVITHVTLRAIPSYNLASVSEVVSFDRFVDELWPDVWTSAEFTRVWWFPYSKHVVLWRANKTAKEPTPTASTFFDTFFGRFFYEALLWVSVNVWPSLTPHVERWAFKKQHGFEDTYGRGKTGVHGSVAGHNMDCLFSQFVNEWAMPLTQGPVVMRTLEQIIDNAAANNEFYVHVPFEVRISNTAYAVDPESVAVGGQGIVPGNNVRPLLDQTPRFEPSDKVSHDKLTLYLNATIYRPFGCDTPIDKWYGAFENVVEQAGGKPHWAKNFLGKRPTTSHPADGEMRGLEPQMPEWYGEDLDLWKTLRKQHDPQGVFLGTNNWASINGLVD